ncbi:MAG TPA: YCF48-related protein, partial [Bacteroidia bacterium]|nr:YCF48-related protein [Bacteroidia bacterium]
MKKVLLVFSLFLFNLTVNAQGTWVSQATNFTPVSSGVRYVSPVDSNIVWICSYDGSAGAANRQDFSRTIDGGMNWVAGTVPVPTSYDWGMIFGLNADTAWSVFYDAVATEGGGIWKTTDGGSTWNQQDSGLIYNATSFPNVVHFWNADTGFTMGDPNPSDYEIYTTSDGGDNWVRVPLVNVPPPLNGEFAIVGHYNVIGDTIWFDTNKGRVYRSVDRGLNWTVSSTGIIVPVDGAIDICFNSATEGLVRLYNNTTGVNTVKHTVDGGDTWTATTITGTLFGSDIKYVPGTAAKMVSTGAATGFIGSSYSNDGGHTWITIETAEQRTALGIVDSVTMWAGGFTSSPTADGIYKFEFLEPIACNDTSVSPGVAVASDTLVCAGDTLTVTATNVLSPTVGDFYGVSWVISSADISGSVSPLLEPSLIATYGITSPSTPTSLRILINDGALIGGGT